MLVFVVVTTMSLTLFLPCVKANVLSAEFEEPVKNWSFTERGSSVYSAVNWASNNGGWRELRGDCYPPKGDELEAGDGLVDIFD